MSGAARRQEADLLAGWLLDLCAVDTTTGREDDGLGPLRDVLDELGATVHLQPVTPGRSNVLATWGEPRVLFSTHVDTVPPYIGPQRRDDAVSGRGSCDAKGQLVAQLGAVRRLLADGHADVAWLGVVGEETTSDGARRALQLADRLAACRAVINGEPTELTVASGQRGVLHLRLCCRGKTAHSSLPHLGRNALWMLWDWLDALRRLPARRDDDLGEESWNLSIVHGGDAANVVPDRAHADILARTIPGSSLLEDIRRAAPPAADVEVLLQEPAVLFPALPGFARATVPFGSDAVTLRAIAPQAAIVLAGPGTIERAHTDDEYLLLDELVDGVALNVRLALHFIGGADRRPGQEG